MRSGFVRVNGEGNWGATTVYGCGPRFSTGFGGSPRNPSDPKLKSSRTDVTGTGTDSTRPNEGLRLLAHPLTPVPDRSPGTWESVVGTRGMVQPRDQVGDSETSVS